jgi:putative MATE family efflux protein
MKNVSMTEENIGKSIALFAFPMLLNSLLQQLFSTVDMYFIGNYIGRNGAAAVGESSVLITCMIGLFTGISTGIGILEARLFGCRKQKEFLQASYAARKLGIAFGMLIMILGWSFMKRLLILFQTPEELLDEALLYTRLYLLGIIPMLLFQTYAAVLKAAGEARLPLYSMMIGGGVNIALDALFIIHFQWGILGASIATAVSQWMVAIWIGLQYRNYVRKKLKETKIRQKLSRKEELFYLKEMIRIGIPAGIQAVLLTFSNLIMQYYVNQLGAYQVAAFSAYFKIETVIYLPILAMGQTIMIFVSQNYGAGQITRVKKGIVCGLEMGFAVTLILSIGMLVLGKEAFWLLIKDKNVIQYGSSIIFATFPFYFLYAILDITGNSIRGLGNSIIPMCNSIISLCIIRIGIVIFWASKYDDIRILGVVYPITWFLCAALNGGCLWKQCKRI